MKLGIYLDLRNPPPWRRSWSTLYGETLELCEEAERLGADSVWLSEHHLFEDGYLPQPLTMAAAVAARTSRVRVGTAVVLPALRHPVHIAEEAAVVDLISGGRLELGLGAGYRVPEYRLFDADVNRRYGSTDSRVRELRRLWAAGEVTPPPVQDPVPIWLGYHGPHGARRAGRLGEGLLSLDPAQLEPYRAGLAEGGHDLSTARVSGMINGFVSDDPDRDWPWVAEHLRYQWDSYRGYMFEGTEHPRPKPIDPDQWRQRGFSSGSTHFVYDTPERTAAILNDALRDSPVTHVFFWASLAGMPIDRVHRHVELLCTKLRPLLDNSSAE